jgi:hypothetical protein
VEIVADDLESLNPRSDSSDPIILDAPAVASPDPVSVEVLGEEIPF